jgi:hypothetical protein
MTRRDMCHLVGKRATRLRPDAAAEAWYILARRLEDDLSVMDVPKFLDLLATIRAATIVGKQLTKDATHQG